MGITQFKQIPNDAYYWNDRLQNIFKNPSLQLRYQTYIYEMLFDSKLNWNTLWALCKRLVLGIGRFYGVSKTLDPTTKLAQLIQTEFLKVYRTERGTVLNVGVVLPSFYRLAADILMNDQAKGQWQKALELSGKGSHDKRRKIMFLFFTECLGRQKDVLSTKEEWMRFTEHTLDIVSELKRVAARVA